MVEWKFLYEHIQYKASSGSFVMPPGFLEILGEYYFHYRAILKLRTLYNLYQNTSVACNDHSWRLFLRFKGERFFMNIK